MLYHNARKLNHESDLSLARKKIYKISIPFVAEFGYICLEDDQQNSKIIPEKAFSLVISHKLEETSFGMMSKTNCVNIALHACLDKVMNDLPTQDIPPNIVHLQQSKTHGSNISPDKTETKDN